MQPVSSAMAEGEPGLIEIMRSFEYFSHKLSLSIDHRNKPLADFYAHELEEVMEDAASIDSYDGYPVGSMVEAMLLPALENIESKLDEGDWTGATTGFDVLIQSCNTCHTATNHGYIKVTKTLVNPFMQSFSPEAE